MTHEILVGVDGSEASLRAVDYAAHEAQREGAQLRLLHVIAAEQPVHIAYPLPFQLHAEESRHIGRTVLEQAKARAEAVIDGERIQLALLPGDRLHRIVEAAQEASVLVLGNERRNLVQRLVTGTVINGAAAHSEAPVVVVPEDWDPGADHHRIVVGVKDSWHCEGLVRRALEIATRRGARLTLLHAWELPRLYDPSALAAIDVGLWADDARAALSETLGTLIAEFPGVEVAVEIEHGQAALRLTAAGAEADLVLIERRGHLFPVGHLGGTARAVLRESTCPVEILPAASEVETDDLVLEEDGAIGKAVLDAD